MVELEQLITEQPNEKSANLSEMRLEEQISTMNNENMNAVRCIESQTAMIERVIMETSAALEKGGRLIYIGAGTSGMIGWLDALECPPTFGTRPEKVLGLLAGGVDGFSNAGVEDHKENGKADLENIQLKSNDIVIGLAASGRTPYVLGALEYAQKIGARTVAVVCNPHSLIAKMCPLTIEAVSGPEVLTGSTRLKAGTTTKLVCNMISTLSMIRIGKIYKNYMVDVKMTNEKLVTRGTNIVMSVTGCLKEQAQDALKKADGQVRIAITMVLLGCSKEQAQKALEKAGGCIQNVEQEVQI